MITVTIGQAGISGFWSPQIIAAIISASVAVITGTVVGYFAWKQWRVAQDKLALDLFDRRFAIWSRIQLKLAERLKEIHSAHDEGKQPHFITENLQSLWVAIDDAHFLFGEDVRAALKKVDDAIFSFGGDSPDSWVDYETTAGRKAKVPARHVGQETVTKALRALREAVEPYMAMQKIGVSRPAKTKPWSWSVWGGPEKRPKTR